MRSLGRVIGLLLLLAGWVLPTWPYYSDSNGADVPRRIAGAANAVDEFGNSSSEPSSLLVPGNFLVFPRFDVARPTLERYIAGGAGGLTESCVQSVTSIVEDGHTPVVPLIDTYEMMVEDVDELVPGGFLVYPSSADVSRRIAEAANAVDDSEPLLTFLIMPVSTDRPTVISISVTTGSYTIFPRLEQGPNFSQRPGCTSGAVPSVSAAGIVVLESGMSSLEQGPDFGQRPGLTGDSCGCLRAATTRGAVPPVSAVGIVVLESGMSSLEQGPDFRQLSHTDVTVIRTVTG
jgi:hypothetical protein